MIRSLFAVLIVGLVTTAACAEPFEVEYRGSIVGYPYVRIIDAPDGSTTNAPYIITLCRTNPCQFDGFIHALPSQESPGFILISSDNDRARLNAQIIQEAVDKVRNRAHRITPDF